MRLALCAVNIFIGALAFMAPNLTRRELLFAVPVPPDFRRNQAARDAIASYRTAIVAVVLATVAVLLFSPAPYLDATAAMAPFAILLVGGFAFYRQNRKLAPAAVQFARPREAELTVAPEELPRFAWRLPARSRSWERRRSFCVLIGAAFPCGSRYIGAPMAGLIVGRSEPPKGCMVLCSSEPRFARGF